jgi:hypothetical protein
MEMGNLPAQFKRFAEKYFAGAYPSNFSFAINALFRVRPIALR